MTEPIVNILDQRDVILARENCLTYFPLTTVIAEDKRGREHSQGYRYCLVTLFLLVMKPFFRRNARADLVDLLISFPAFLIARISFWTSAAVRLAMTATMAVT